MRRITGPDGEELVTLTLDEYEDLIDSRDHALAMRELEAGRMPVLSEAEVTEALLHPECLDDDGDAAMPASQGPRHRTAGAL